MSDRHRRRRSSRAASTDYRRRRRQTGEAFQRVGSGEICPDSSRRSERLVGVAFAPVRVRLAPTRTRARVDSAAANQASLGRRDRLVGRGATARARRTPGRLGRSRRVCSSATAGMMMLSPFPGAVAASAPPQHHRRPGMPRRPPHEPCRVEKPCDTPRPPRAAASAARAPSASPWHARERSQLRPGRLTVRHRSSWHAWPRR